MIARLLPNFDEGALFLENIAFIAEPLALIQVRQTTLDKLLENLRMQKWEKNLNAYVRKKESYKKKRARTRNTPSLRVKTA